VLELGDSERGGDGPHRCGATRRGYDAVPVSWRQALRLALALTGPLFAAAAPASTVAPAAGVLGIRAADGARRGRQLHRRAHALPHVRHRDQHAHPDCGGLFGLDSNASGSPLRVRVDRRGRFRTRRHAPTDGIAALRGRFRSQPPRLA
jgi:hypothetical protein